MSVQHKRIASLVSIGLLVSMLGACKELDQITTEDTQDVDSPGMQNPTTDNMHPDHAGHGSTDQMLLKPTSMLNLKAMKINGLPVEVSLFNVQQPWGVTNNTPAILDSTQINTLEFDFSNTPVFDSIIYRIEFRLRSLLEEKYFNIAINQLGVINGQLTLLPETSMDINYQDYMTGGYGYYGQIAESNMISLSQFKMTLNITALMSNVTGGIYPDKPMPIGVPSTAPGTSSWGGCIGGVSPSDCSIGVANHDHAITPVPNGTTSSTQFFTNDLYSVTVYYDGEMYYQGSTLRQLSSCVFASADAPPADISDICQAYLTVYK